MNVHIGWPQGIVLLLMVVEIAMVGVLHGKPRTQKYNVIATGMAQVVWFALLYWGGFFRG